MTFNRTSSHMLEAVAYEVDAAESRGLDVHTVTLTLNGQHGEFDLKIEATDDDMEDVEVTGIAHRGGGVTEIRTTGETV